MEKLIKTSVEKQLLKDYVIKNLYYRYHNGCMHTYDNISLDRAEYLYLSWINDFTKINEFANYHRMQVKDVEKFLNEYKLIRSILLEN